MHRVVVMTAVLACVVPAFADDSPMRVRNVAPASGIYGIPQALGGEVLANGLELTFGAAVANNFTSEANGATIAFFDGETTYFTYGVRHAIAPRWEWGVEVPYVIHRGGHLDATVDNFHDLFGFDDNGRNSARRNQIDYFVSDRDEVSVDFQKVRRDWGDVRVGGGFQLLRVPERSLALRALVKLPTGDVNKLTGSDGTDIAMWLDYTDRELLARLRLSMTGAMGVIVLGDGDLLPQKQKRFAGYGHYGVSYALTDRWALKGQLDYHSQLINASVDQLGGAALQGSVGATWQLTPKLRSDIVLVEDLTGDSTSDVMLQILIAAKL